MTDSCILKKKDFFRKGSFYIPKFILLYKTQYPRLYRFFFCEKSINVLSAPAYQMCKTEIDTQWWNMINWWFPKLMKAIDIQYRRLKSCVSLAMVKIENHGFLCWYRIVPKISLKNINGRKLNMQSLSVRLVSLVVCLSVSPPLSLSLCAHWTLLWCFPPSALRTLSMRSIHK